MVLSHTSIPTVNPFNGRNSCEMKASDMETDAAVNLSKKILSGAILALGLLPLYGYLFLGHIDKITYTYYKPLILDEN